MIDVKKVLKAVNVRTGEKEYEEVVPLSDFEKLEALAAGQAATIERVRMQANEWKGNKGAPWNYDQVAQVLLSLLPKEIGK